MDIRRQRPHVCLYVKGHRIDQIIPSIQERDDYYSNNTCLDGWYHNLKKSTEYITSVNPGRLVQRDGNALKVGPQRDHNKRHRS